MISIRAEEKNPSDDSLLDSACATTGMLPRKPRKITVVILLNEHGVLFM